MTTVDLLKLVHLGPLCPPIHMGTPQTCSFGYSPELFKVVHFRMRAVGLRLKDLLVKSMWFLININ